MLSWGSISLCQQQMHSRNVPTIDVVWNYTTQRTMLLALLLLLQILVIIVIIGIALSSSQFIFIDAVERWASRENGLALNNLLKDCRSPLSVVALRILLTLLASTVHCVPCISCIGCVRIMSLRVETGVWLLAYDECFPASAGAVAVT